MDGREGHPKIAEANGEEGVYPIYPKLIHLPKFYPESFVRFGNLLFGDLIGWPFFVLFNNILNASLTLTNAFAIRREDFVEFKPLYPGERTSTLDTG